MNNFAFIILVITAIISTVVHLSRSRKGYVLEDTLMNKILIVIWITSNLILALFLLIINHAFSAAIEIAIALNLLWPWFLLTMRKDDNDSKITK